MPYWLSFQPFKTKKLRKRWEKIGKESQKIKHQQNFGKHYSHLKSFRALCMPGDPSTALKVLLAGQLIEDPAPKLQCSGHLGPATKLESLLRS